MRIIVGAEIGRPEMVGTGLRAKKKAKYKPELKEE